MRLLYHGLEVAAVTGDREPHDREHELQVSAAVQRLRFRDLRRDREMALGLIRRPSVQLARRPKRAQLSIGSYGAQREAGKELMGRGPLTAQDEAEPVVRQQATSDRPLLRCLRVADRFNRVAVFRKPRGGRAV